jgi:ribosomal protein S18 acetylase RimI-like enzyme
MFRIATITDIPALVTLLNEAYRGEASQRGWTSEAHLISGETRTNEENVQDILQLPGSIFYVYTVNDKILGCVNLQQKEELLYLGMLCVSPLLQGKGIGKKLLQQADEHARQLGCHTIQMTVISLRQELIDWYNRHGYVDTGKRTNFIEDAISGKHLQPLQFAYLEKKSTSS